MRLQLAALPLASTLILMAASPAIAADAPACDTIQMSTYYAARGTLQTKCDYILSSFFGTCSDECYAHFKKVAAVSPNCTLSGMSTTPRADDELFVKRCEDARANATSTYIPQTQQGLTNCSAADEDAWELKYGYSSPNDNCVTTIMTAKTCSDECLKSLQEGVEAAKVCRLQGDYSSRELKKKDLVGCLQARGEDLKTNELLQSLPVPTLPPSESDSAGVNKSSSDVAATTAPSASSASATTLTVAVGVTTIVAVTLSLSP